MKLLQLEGRDDKIVNQIEGVDNLKDIQNELNDIDQN